MRFDRRNTLDEWPWRRPRMDPQDYVVTVIAGWILVMIVSGGGRVIAEVVRSAFP